MIPYSRQQIDEADIKAVVKTLRSDWLTQGPAIAQFETALASYTGARYAVVFSNGTAALHGAYFAAGLKAGDEFVTTALTFAATANAGLYLGAKPVFADVDAYGNLDPKAVAKKITKKTKMIAVVDYTGRPADLASFKRLAKKNNLIFIEDACQALGARYQGKKVGAISDLTVFSFHPVKTIATGEGGAVVTDSKKYYEKLLLFRSHGITKDPTRFKYKSPGDWYMEMQALGFNYRLTDLQAALGISQLKKADRFVSARKKIAARYARSLKNLSEFIELPSEEKNSSSSWHLYVIRLKGKFAKKRAIIFKKLREAGIGVQVHHLPVYWHPYYRELGYKKGLCPKAEEFYESAISLPIFPGLSNTDQRFVIQTIKSLIAKT